MGKSMNVICITGNLGKDAEVRQVGDRSVANFSVAVGDRSKINGQWEDTTLWFKVALWGRAVDGVSRYLTKGTRVAVSGRLGVDTWTASDGTTRTDLKIDTSDVTLLGGGAESTGGTRQAAAPVRGMPDDDVPF